MDQVGDPKGETDASRKALQEEERLKQLRERLYARTGESGTSSVRHSLQSDIQPPPRPVVPPPVLEEQLVDSTLSTMSQRRGSFRLKLALVGVIFFIGALLTSGYFLFMGQNTISGNNISIEIDGPIAVGGGDAMNLQIAITNENSLPIESATLILEYPKGTQSVTEKGKEIFTERQQLNNINPGETVTVPIKALMFGEENEEKAINVSVEYRVRGSNATFSKDASPFAFKISTSPVIATVTGVKQAPSGEEIDIEVLIESNAPTPLTNLLVRGTYPPGFDFTEATPETVSGEETWRIEELRPGEKKTITLRGVVVGKEKDVQRFSFAVGVANERDAFNLISLLTTGEAELTIEQPFLDVAYTINGIKTNSFVLDREATAGVNVAFTNTLETIITNSIVKVQLEGNALDEITVDVEDGGFYDSVTNLITWDSVGFSDLKEIAPGSTKNVSFTIDPLDEVGSTPEIRFRVSISGDRYSEDNVLEEVAGTTDGVIRVQTVAKLTSSALYSEGPFNNSGPIPPVAEKTTEYTFLLSLRNGTNQISDTEVTATLPPYITWLDRVSNDDVVKYNPATRMLVWDIGDMDANGYEEAWIQVAFRPSLSQYGMTPTILETQRFKATDKFTSTIIRGEAPALTTDLVDDPDEEARDGQVRKEGD